MRVYVCALSSGRAFRTDSGGRISKCLLIGDQELRKKMTRKSSRTSPRSGRSLIAPRQLNERKKERERVGQHERVWPVTSAAAIVVDVEK